MVQSIERAKQRAEEARAALEPALVETGNAFKEALDRAINSMLDLTVVAQADRTTAMDPAELTILKVNVTQAIDTAMAGVDAALKKLDIDRLASRAQRNTSGLTYVDSNAILSPLLSPIGGLLEKAGYNIRVLKASSMDVSYRLAPPLAGSSTASTAARRLDHAIEEYGKAKLEISEAEQAAAAAAARTAWDQA